MMTDSLHVQLRLRLITLVKIKNLAVNLTLKFCFGTLKKNSHLNLICLKEKMDSSDKDSMASYAVGDAASSFKTK